MRLTCDAAYHPASVKWHSSKLWIEGGRKAKRLLLNNLQIGAESPAW